MSPKEYLAFLEQDRDATHQLIHDIIMNSVPRPEERHWTLDSVANSQCQVLKKRLADINQQIQTITQHLRNLHKQTEHRQRAAQAKRRATEAAKAEVGSPLYWRVPEEDDHEYAPIPPALPVSVTEVPTLPHDGDHAFVDTITRRANTIISWSYASLNGGQYRRSRRYEGFTRG